MSASVSGAKMMKKIYKHLNKATGDYDSSGDDDYDPNSSGGARPSTSKSRAVQSAHAGAIINNGAQSSPPAKKKAFKAFSGAGATLGGGSPAKTGEKEEDGRPIEDTATPNKTEEEVAKKTTGGRQTKKTKAFSGASATVGGATVKPEAQNKEGTETEEEEAKKTTGGRRAKKTRAFTGAHATVGGAAVKKTEKKKKAGRPKKATGTQKKTQEKEDKKAGRPKKVAATPKKEEEKAKKTTTAKKRGAKATEQSATPAKRPRRGTKKTEVEADE